MTHDLSGRTALLTGASGGLGLHIAGALADTGMRLALSGRSAPALHRLRDDLRERGAFAEVVPADLAQAESAARRLVADAERAVGPIDVVVGNAGVERTSRYADVAETEIVETVAVNLVGPMLVVRAVLPGMLKRGRGHIVLVGSVAGSMGIACTAPYTATKAALLGFVRALRAELRDAPVGISYVAPGYVADTGMYERMLEEAPGAGARTGVTEAGRVTRAVLRSLRRDLPDVNVAGGPVRPAIAAQALAPRLVERAMARLGFHAPFERLAAERRRRR